MAEATWSQLPNGPWIWLTEKHCGLFTVAENECISLVVRVQACTLAQKSDFRSLVPSRSFQAEARSQGAKLPGKALLWKALPAENLMRESNTLYLPLI